MCLTTRSSMVSETEDLLISSFLGIIIGLIFCFTLDVMISQFHKHTGTTPFRNWKDVSQCILLFIVGILAIYNGYLLDTCRLFVIATGHFRETDRDKHKTKNVFKE
jgi:hypothetical protein